METIKINKEKDSLEFAHIADIHLGYSSGSKLDTNTHINLREQDGYNALDYCIEDIIKNKVSFVLCTGDFFHSPNPSARTIVNAQRILDKLTQNNIPFICLAGNHDATDAVRDIPSSVILHNPNNNWFSYSEPYKIIEIPNSNVVLHLISHHNYVNQRDTMDMIKLDDNKINILCTHGSCYDSNLEIIVHSEAEPREVVIPEDILNLNWSYILLGHIHERGWIGSKDKIHDTTGQKRFYAGSLIRRGFSDGESKLGRGWTKWSVNENTKEMTPTFFNVPQRLQLEISFECIDKGVVEVENEIEECFKNIILTENPILKFYFIDIAKEVKTQINWSRFTEYTSQCLSFIINNITKEEAKKIVTKDTFSFDLFSAFKLYWKQVETDYNENDRDTIYELSNKYLKLGQEKILERME